MYLSKHPASSLYERKLHIKVVSLRCPIGWEKLSLNNFRTEEKSFAFTSPLVPLVIIGVVFWIVWHVWQIKTENKTFAEDEAKLRNHHSMEETIKRQNSLN